MCRSNSRLARTGVAVPARIPPHYLAYADANARLQIGVDYARVFGIEEPFLLR
jgi:hypothetical protein